jgi:hypothetical protein
MSATMTLLLLSAMEVLGLVAGAEERQQEMRARYVYLETQENWRLDPYGRSIAGSNRSKTFEVLLVNGQRYRKLIGRNGKPLTAAEAWEVEEDMKRAQPKAEKGSLLRDLASTHEIVVEDSVIVAKGASKNYTITFDPETHAIRKQVSEGGGTRMVIEYTCLPGGVYLPQRVEVDFTVGDVHGLQVSTFSNFKAN